MSEGRTKTRLHSPMAPPDAQNDDAATVAAHAAAGAAHAAVTGTQATPATPGALPVESELPLFPNIHVKGGARPAKLAVYKEKGGELAYLGVLTDVGATEERIRSMFGAGTFRLELRDESNRVLKGGQRHGVRIDPDPRDEPAKPDTETKTLVHVVDQVALERKLADERLKLMREEREDSLARRKAEADIEIKRAREEAELREKAAEAKAAREMAWLQERAKADLERERLRYEADRARDQAQMQMFLTMQGKQTEVVLQALTAQKTDVGMFVGALKDGMALGAQTAQGNPEMAQMGLMGKGIDAIAGALGGGGGGGGPQQQVQALENGAKKELAGAGVEPTKAQRMIAKMKLVVGKAVSHGIDPEEALDAFIQQIEDYENQGGDEGDEEPAPPAKGKTDAAPAKPAAPAAPAAGNEPRRRSTEPARSETRPVAQRAGGDRNGARAQRASGGDRPRGARR